MRLHVVLVLDEPTDWCLCGLLLAFCADLRFDLLGFGVVGFDASEHRLGAEVGSAEGACVAVEVLAVELGAAFGASDVGTLASGDHVGGDVGGACFAGLLESLLEGFDCFRGFHGFRVVEKDSMIAVPAVVESVDRFVGFLLVGIDLAVMPGEVTVVGTTLLPVLVLDLELDLSENLVSVHVSLGGDVVYCVAHGACPFSGGCFSFSLI